MKAYAYTFGDFIDRLCIVSKKALCNLPGAEKELADMMGWCKKSGVDGEFLLGIVRLAQANLTIWDLEHSVRNARRPKRRIRSSSKRRWTVFISSIWTGKL